MLFQKWQKINFCTGKKFKTTKNAFFCLENQDFLTEITIFSTFQLNVDSTKKTESKEEKSISTSPMPKNSEKQETNNTELDSTNPTKKSEKKV